MFDKIMKVLTVFRRTDVASNVKKTELWKTKNFLNS